MRLTPSNFSSLRYLNAEQNILDDIYHTLYQIGKCKSKAILSLITFEVVSPCSDENVKTEITAREVEHELKKDGWDVLLLPNTNYDNHRFYISITIP